MLVFIPIVHQLKFLVFFKISSKYSQPSDPYGPIFLFKKTTDLIIILQYIPKIIFFEYQFIFFDIIGIDKRHSAEPTEKPKKKKSLIIINDDSDDEEEKPKRYKYRVPEYLFILDDLSTELSNPAVTSLLKKNRHFLSKVIISNQYWNDLAKSARKNMDYMIIFGAQPKDKLQEIHKELDLSLTFDEFYKLYKYATKERFSFLYIDVVNETFRRSFDTSLIIE